MNNLVIVSRVRDGAIDKHYVIRSNDGDDITLVGNVCISGSIVSVCNTHSDACKVVENLTY